LLFQIFSLHPLLLEHIKRDLAESNGVKLGRPGIAGGTEVARLVPDVILVTIMLMLVEELVEVKEINRFNIELIDVRVARIACTDTNKALFVDVGIVAATDAGLEVALVSISIAHVESGFLEFEL
jgi:hypothetical protein